MRTTLLSLLLLSGIAAQANLSLSLFSNANYQGKSVAVYEDWTCNQDNLCYDIESIRVSPGVEALVYPHDDFTGTPLHLTSSWDGTTNTEFCNRVGSIRLIRWTDGFCPMTAGVVLSTRENLGGKNAIVNTDWTCDQASMCYDIESALVPEEWTAWFYANNDFTGKPLRITGPFAGNLPDSHRNRVGSVQIVESSNCFQNVSRGAVVCTQEDFGGKHTFVNGDWTCDDAGFCYDIESIYVPQGFAALVFSNHDFSGRSIELTSSWDGHTSYPEWSNSVGSIRVYRYFEPDSSVPHPSGPVPHPVPPKTSPTVTSPAAHGVILYEHDETHGRQKVITQDWTITSGNSDFNDVISTIVVPDGWIVRAYQHAHYEGKHIDIIGRWFAPDDDVWWNDKISSIRVVRVFAPE